MGGERETEPTSEQRAVHPVGAWPNKKEDYDLQDAIGVGATATVYKVLDKKYYKSRVAWLRNHEWES
jgi:hypothetical protein